MTKNQALLTGVRDAAVLMETTIGFLLARQQVIRLTPMETASNPGYIWRRVFLRGRRQA